ncbi:MAG TPA: isoprenylcysteine carboxylmethyltransferase family protein [Pyrinomonadaceae bacterium]
MEVEELYPIFFSLFQIYWAVVWAAKHLEIRRQRHYAEHRTPADTNPRYKIVSYFLYVSQNLLCLTSFWSNSEFLLKVHDRHSMRFAGMILIILATVLYFKSLRSLGRNYSPCFDSHVPLELITSGAYKFIRHPLYLSKLVIVIGNFVISGSLWFLLMFVYLAWETVRTIIKEEKYLATSVQGYLEYKKRTTRMIPFVF